MASSLVIPQVQASFPAALLDWAGHRGGGVRRLFYDGSGRPAGSLIETPLLELLRAWSKGIASAHPNAPRVVLLVGGPGNGKTEAIEETIRSLERALAIDGKIQSVLAPLFQPSDGTTVPRLVTLDIGRHFCMPDSNILTLVQDASATDPLHPGKSCSALLVEDLERVLEADKHQIYLACVNRGVLDDALIFATDNHRSSSRNLLEAVVRSTSQSLSAPRCWPLEGHESVAVWPMDVESLLRRDSTGTSEPARRVLDLALDATRWPAAGMCVAGIHCPFCGSRETLAAEPQRDALLRILRWYELASGKRWSFRDLLSIISYLLAGAPEASSSSGRGPCEWAARLHDLDLRPALRSDRQKLTAPFLLMAAQYQHALFGRWPETGRRGIRQELKELGLGTNETLLGLHYFISERSQASMPETLRAQLFACCDLLDPALADPDAEVPLSTKTRVHLRDIEIRFSHSVRDGFDFVRRYHCLSVLETDVLSRVAASEELVLSPEIRKKKPHSADRLSVLLRDFACRIVKRTLGTRGAVVRDCDALQAFENVLNGDRQILHQAMKQVENLLNEEEKFVIDLNTTFGEDVPPSTRRVVLYSPKQRVRAPVASKEGKPASDLIFLTAGANTTTQSLSLTYELFHSVRSLQNGMLSASLPRGVKAALDATRARLAGQVVRDEDQLDGAKIRIGTREEIITREMGGFVVHGASS